MTHPRTNRQTRAEARHTARTQRKIMRASTDWNALALALIEVQK